MWETPGRRGPASGVQPPLRRALGDISAALAKSPVLDIGGERPRVRRRRLVLASDVDDDLRRALRLSAGCRKLPNDDSRLLSASVDGANGEDLRQRAPCSCLIRARDIRTVVEGRSLPVETFRRTIEPASTFVPTRGAAQSSRRTRWPGLNVDAGSVVRLNVSTGSDRPSIAVPDVTGANQAAARRTLSKIFTVRTVYRSGEEPGVVVGQLPAAGAQAKRWAQVIIYVGR